MLIAMMMEVATESQPLQFAGLAPNVCLVPAPPRPPGRRASCPFPILADSSSISESPADGVRHQDKKVMTTDSVASGIKGNEAGVGMLPPSKRRRTSSPG